MNHEFILRQSQIILASNYANNIETVLLEVKIEIVGSAAVGTELWESEWFVVVLDENQEKDEKNTFWLKLEDEKGITDFGNSKVPLSFLLGNNFFILLEIPWEELRIYKCIIHNCKVFCV